MYNTNINKTCYVSFEEYTGVALIVKLGQPGMSILVDTNVLILQYVPEIPFSVFAQIPIIGS